MDLNGGSYSRLNWWWYARPSPLFCVILRTLVKKSEENHGESSWYILGYLYPITLLDVKFDILILISNYPNYPNCWISRWLQHVVSGHSSHETLIWVMRIFVPLLSRFHDSYETLVLLALAMRFASSGKPLSQGFFSYFFHEMDPCYGEYSSFSTKRDP